MKLFNNKIKKIHYLQTSRCKSHQDATGYYICKQRLIKKFVKDESHCKVRNHCHYTGKYSGSVHSNCDLRSNVPNEIPVVFHKQFKL